MKKLEAMLFDSAKKSVFLMVVLYIIGILMSMAGFSGILVSFNFAENIIGYFLTFLVGFLGLEYLTAKYGLPIRATGYARDIVEAFVFLVLLYVFGIIFSMAGIAKFFVTLTLASNLIGYLITFALGFIALDFLEKQF